MYESWTIIDCIEEVNKRIFLPDIQRPYVWKENDIYLLYDSICRDYPINTLLFWYLKKETLSEKKYLKRIKFICQSDEEYSTEHGALTKDNYYMVIDGQQRLTSFYLTLNGLYKNKKNEEFDLYFNFLSGETENEKEMLFEFQFFNIVKPDVWIEEYTLNKGTKGIVTKYWIRLKSIISIENRAEINSTISDIIKKAINIDIPNNKRDLIFDIWMKIKSDKLITCYIEKTQDYDKVLDVFIRTNSGGQKLSYSDLLFSYIKLHWNEARDKFSNLIKILNNQGTFKFSNDVILKTILFIHAYDTNSLKYRTSNFTSKIIETTRDEWDTKIIGSFKLLYDLLLNKFLLTNDKLITSYNALIPIVYFLYINNYKALGDENNNLSIHLQTKIREWLITSMLTGVFGGQSDGILHKAKLALTESGESNYFPKEELFIKFNEAKKSLKLEIDEKLISQAAYNSTESYLILSLLYRNSVNFAPQKEDNKPQQDHIISRGELKKANIDETFINSIYNIRYISASDNRIKSDETFEKWSKRIGQDVMNQHFIPEGNWSASNYDEFLEKRKMLFLKQLGVI
ncbi:MAG: DUF262 domain-containing protein [bacterium]